MITKVEVNGYEIIIEEKEGMVYVQAMKDEDIVEEFVLEVEEDATEEKEDDIKSFDKYKEGEEEDFDNEELKDEEEVEEDEKEEEDKFESVKSFAEFIK